FEGFSTDEVADVVIEDLRRRELLVDSGRITHRYPTCWRCGTPLVFRVVDDWFIACDEIRQPMLEANATVEWTPSFYSKRMDDWLDAGIVPFSTLGWQNPEWVPGGYATGAAEGLSGADLPDHSYWEQWFPADWISEMREQIRLWFYSISFMSMTLVGRSPYRKVLTYEKLLDETGREMHRSWGNSI